MHVLALPKIAHVREFDFSRAALCTQPIFSVNSLLTPLSLVDKGDFFHSPGEIPYSLKLYIVF